MLEESRASEQDGSYPRPQLVRTNWLNLSGEWGFAYDDDDTGRAAGWATTPEVYTRTITVPFPPEAPLSGVGDPGYHRVVWYRRRVSREQLAAAGHAPDRALLLHFGAVDYRADVWVDGHHVAFHEGGHTPFAVDLSGVPDEDLTIVVRAEDDPHDLSQPRGKQDWATEPHVIWYHRTTGIWQPVWLESLPAQHITRLAWRPSIADSHVELTLELATPPSPGTEVRISLTCDGRSVAQHTVSLATRREVIVITLPSLRNGQAHENLLWSPESPTLIDAQVELLGPEPSDSVRSYFGVRSLSTGSGRFLLNGRPYPVHAILSQGYWPQSHLAAPDADALRREVELIKALGFTTARVHQKVEDPRLLYWADRLGLLIWAEMPSAYEFSEVTAKRLVREWADVILRDESHPSIVAWVPLNESWGVPHLETDERQQNLARTLFHLTKTLDGTRLVISNDGWEHIQSDLLTVHDYESDGDKLAASYRTTAVAIENLLSGIAPNGRRMLVGTAAEAAATAAQPIVLSEFGGVSFAPGDEKAWGYSEALTPKGLEEHLRSLFAAVHSSRALAGWCYTQLTDTMQETNGLTDEWRVPKLRIEDIRAIVTGIPGAKAESTLSALEPVLRERQA